MIKAVGMLLILFFAQAAVAYDVPADKKYSPGRDIKINRILSNASNKAGDFITVEKFALKKLRGYKTGGNLWSNEQWSYIVEVKNNTRNNVICNFVNLNVYDAGGFLLDKYLLFAGALPLTGEIVNKSDMFFIKLTDINEISSADITANCFKR